MKAVKYFIKTVLWSIGISIFIRIAFGACSAFGAIVLLVPLILAIIAAVSLSTSSNGGFTAVSSIHILLTTAFYAFFDYSGLFRTLPSDSAVFFSRFIADDAVMTNMLLCILLVMPVYFFSFIITSGIIASVRNKRLMAETEADEYYEEDTEEYDDYEDGIKIRHKR